MQFPNHQLTNPTKKAEQDKFRISPRCSKRLAARHGRQHKGTGKTKAPKLIHYQDKFWKLSPAGYIIKDQGTHFVTNSNISASTHARRERKRELYIKTNKKLTEEAIKQFNEEKEWQATLSL
jgi:hypothetical protein